MSYLSQQSGQPVAILRTETLARSLHHRLPCPAYPFFVPLEIDYQQVSRSIRLLRRMIVRLKGITFVTVIIIAVTDR